MKRIDFENGTITGNILGATLPMLVALQLRCCPSSTGAEDHPGSRRDDSRLYCCDVESNHPGSGYSDSSLYF